LKTLGSIAKEAIEACVIDVRIPWYPIIGIQLQKVQIAYL